MSVYAIGDIQGCYEPLLRLLEQIRFAPADDRLWFVGDLVNRGPQSLEVLRLVKSLGEAAVTVLGNHDLHLLALAASFGRVHKSDTFGPILAAPDRDELLHWLQHRPLAWREGDYLLLHAGMMPAWRADDAMRLAAEAETVLQQPNARDFFAHMYGDSPRAWRDDLQGMDRIRVIVNTFTRMRYCSAQGEMDFHHKGAPGSQAPGLFPWFDVPERRSTDTTIIMGHWSTLGLIHRSNLLALDTGCLWGGALTAVRLEDREVFSVGCSPTRQGN